MSIFVKISSANIAWKDTLPDISEEYSQIKIKFDEINISIEKKYAFPYIEGFDIDENGCLYFLSGINSELQVFENEKKLFSKRYDLFSPTNIYIYDNNIYVFCQDIIKGEILPRNDLYVIDKKNGEILKCYKHILKKHSNILPQYKDSIFIVEVTNEASSDREYFAYDLKGNFIKKTYNHLDVSKVEFSTIYSPLLKDSFHGFKYLGKYNGGYLYFNKIYRKESDENNSIIQITKTDTFGNIIGEYKIDEKILGNEFLPSSFNYEIIKNDVLYFLRFDDNNVVITKLYLKKIFNDK